MKALGYTKEHAPGAISPYLPDFIADDITGVDFAELKRIGVTHILLDLDQTLRRAYSKHLETEVIHVFQELKKKQTFSAIVIASNNSRNLTKFAAPIDARVFQPFWTGGRIIRKPNPLFFTRIMRELGIKPSQAAMIGDKLRADIIGANKAGIRTVLVKPRGYDYWYDLLLLSRLREQRYYQQALTARRKHTSSTITYLQATLLESGLPAKHIVRHTIKDGASDSYIARDNDRAVFVKLLSRQKNITDYIRHLRSKFQTSRPGSEILYLGPKHALEHEAKIASLAHHAGVKTPKIEQIIDLGDYRYGLVTEYIEGKALDALPKTKITHALLAKVWQQINMLHKAHIAHRDLQASNIITNGTEVWLTDFDHGRAKANVRVQAEDNADLLISLSLLIGPERASQSAVAHLSKRKLLLMIPLIGTAHAPRITRRGLMAQPDLITRLRTLIETNTKKQ